MHMSESTYLSGMNHTRVYTMVRPPSEHVLSQYFHCAEARNRDPTARGLIPSLDEWLENWVSFMETGVLPRPIEHHFNIHMRWMYKCYNPINLQSRFLEFNETLSPDSSKEDLNQRFETIGLTTNFDKSICLILIRLTGEVPVACDCTSKRRLRQTHGVVHHGANFTVSESQSLAISKLTKVDEKLFGYAAEIFKENLKGAEEMYSVKLCDKLDVNKELLTNAGELHFSRKRRREKQ